jgi:hypothetical protein
LQEKLVEGSMSTNGRSYNLKLLLTGGILLGVGSIFTYKYLQLKVRVLKAEFELKAKMLMVKTLGVIAVTAALGYGLVKVKNSIVSAVESFTASVRQGKITK